MTTTTSWVREYMNHERLGGKSEQTLAAYQNALKQLMGYLQGKSLVEATLEDLEGFVAEIRKRTSLQTTYLYARVARAFFSFLQDHNRILASPAAGLGLVRLKKGRMGRILSPAEVERLLASCEVSCPLGLRDRALIELAYSTAARISELRGLWVSDVDLENLQVHIQRAKGARDRVVPLGRTAAHWIGRYLSESRPRLVTNVDPQELFVSHRGRPLSRQVMFGYVRKIGRRAGVPMMTIHAIRRTVATRMIENGATPAHVAELLGHGDLRTLARYARVAAEKTRTEHSRCHPREAEHE